MGTCGPPPGLHVLPREWYDRDSLKVAPDLLNKVLASGDGRRGRIVEVEAYRGPDDPGSHAFRGPTKRNATMWGPPGHLYVYFVYGMHWCANVVCGPPGVAHAVLVRAVAAEAGLEVMRAARWGGDPARRRPRPDRDLCRGPARLCQAFAITGADDGTDLVAAGGTIAPAASRAQAPVVPGTPVVTIGDDGVGPPASPLVTTRVGLSAGADLPWRFAVPDHRGVSRWMGAPRRGRARLR
ncbi:MAG: DNA-3-methyladenine glycosylase [Actinomycetota bacterium]|nr:DNA-3-methyladenine glycosylase [Actinomycetota bacterium]MDQ6947297.1 DNA-3-methyladenine glycosylase [Actinomycetota bacterium]